MPKKLRVCKVCGTEFVGKYSGTRGNLVCSEVCRRKRIVESKTKGKHLNCKHCGKEFWVRPSRLEDNAQYCTVDCWKADFPDPIECKCDHCGNTYSLKPSLAKNNRYCSTQCKQLHERERHEVECSVCAKKMIRTPSNINESGKHACSQECNAVLSLERVFFQSHTNTKPERMFNEQTPDFINQTSDGKFYINFKTGKIKNPDFIVRPVNKTKKVIEIFGRYWHPESEQQQLISLYKEVGYDCLVIWEEEVYEGTYHDKLRLFLEGVPS